MSEYMEKFNVSRLVGAPPGYVGYEEGGQLTEKVRRKPYSVVLLDEIEKAHPDTFNILLQVLDDGLLTDGLGRKVDFKNTIIIMTSNIGTRDIKLNKVFGFGDPSAKTDYEKIKSTIEENVKKVFSPEFLNRIDEMLIFRQLEKEDIIKIVEIGINKLLTRVQLHGVKVDVAKTAMEFLADKGFDQNFGARPLRRAIQKYLEDPLSEEILKGKFKDGGKIKVKYKKGNDDLTFTEDNNKDAGGAKDAALETLEESKDNHE